MNTKKTEADIARAVYTEAYVQLVDGSELLQRRRCLVRELSLSCFPLEIHLNLHLVMLLHHQLLQTFDQLCNSVSITSDIVSLRPFCVRTLARFRLRVCDGGSLMAWTFRKIRLNFFSTQKDFHHLKERWLGSLQCSPNSLAKMRGQRRRRKERKKDKLGRV